MALIKFANEKECSKALMEAMKSGDEQKIQEAWEQFHQSVVEQVKVDSEELIASNDSAILAQRGYRQLTNKETKWYQKFIEALKSSNPKQAVIDLLGTDKEEDFMPTTIIEDVYKDLVAEHPLLQAINFQYVGYLTKWLLNDHATQKAVWGTITDEIVKEITSSFEVIDLNQSKLSAFACIELGMLDLGPTFLDGYIRTILGEALLEGLEDGIVMGTGLKQPIGLIRNISKGVSVSQETGYPAKEKIAVTDFMPEHYGPLVARMAKTEKGKKRKFTEVGLICNQNDYLTKIMPATTVLNANGVYVNDLFPIPTTVYISNVLEDGEAVLFLKNEYFMGMGGDKKGVIEYSDEYKFLEDMRYFKVKQYGAGRAFDNTSALYLDITGLEPAYITVKNHEVVEA
jgi:HK97 family phage major capsid protein